MTCTSCGFTFDDVGQAFCPNCGAPIVRDESAQPIQPQFQQPEQPQFQQPEQPQFQQPEQPQFQQPEQLQYQQPVQPQYQPVQPQPYYQPVQPQPYYQPVQPLAGYNTTPILVWGILGLAFACTFYFSFLGIIFSSIAMSKASAYIAAGGILSGKSKTGRILGKVGLILGIVLTVIAVLVIFACISTVY